MKESPASPALLHPSSLADSMVQPGGLEMRRVSTSADWHDVRSIRYAALRTLGEIVEADDCAHGDDHDHALNATTLLLALNAKPIACTRVSAANKRHERSLPAMEAFASEIDRAVEPESTIVEASLIAVDPGAPTDHRATVLHLFKGHLLQCAIEDADWLLVAVRDTQIGFYRRMFDMEILSGPEPYPGVASPRVLMGLDCRVHAAALFKRIPWLAVTPEDERDFLDSGVITFDARRRSAVGTAAQDASRPA